MSLQTSSWKSWFYKFSTGKWWWFWFTFQTQKWGELATRIEDSQVNDVALTGSDAE